MEREILFRGKSIDNGEWVYGYLLKRPSAIQMPGYGGPWYIWVPPGDPDDSGGYCNVDPATVGQYTGMPDKNGKKIFEGDILSVWKSKFLVAVKFSTDYDLSWECVNKNIGEHYRHRLECNSEKYEVVGNIYDNPELLR